MTILGAPWSRRGSPGRGAAEHRAAAFQQELHRGQAPFLRREHERCAEPLVVLVAGVHELHLLRPRRDATYEGLLVNERAQLHVD